MIKTVKKHSHAFLFFLGGLFLMLVGPSLISLSSAATVDSTVNATRLQTSMDTQNNTLYINQDNINNTDQAVTFEVIPTNSLAKKLRVYYRVNGQIISQTFLINTQTMGFTVNLLGQNLFDGASLAFFDNRDNQVGRAFLVELANTESFEKQAGLLDNGKVCRVDADCKSNFCFENDYGTKTCRTEVVVVAGAAAGARSTDAPTDPEHGSADNVNTLRSTSGPRNWVVGEKYITSQDVMARVGQLSPNEPLTQTVQYFIDLFRGFFDAINENLRIVMDMTELNKLRIDYIQNQNQIIIEQLQRIAPVSTKQHMDEPLRALDIQYQTQFQNLRATTTNTTSNGTNAQHNAAK